MLRTIIERLLIHWKTSLSGFVLLVLLVFLWMGKITVQEFVEIIGGLGVVGLLSGKDAKAKDNEQ